ncbi:hypothetical protein [Streptomyces sp. NPDC054901]
MAFDRSGDVWAANFGFQGRGCPLDPDPLFRSVSQFDPRGRALSPPQGRRQGDFVQPQGLATGRDGTVWVADFSGQRVTRLCGVRTEACPPGHRTGQPISPASAGYGFDGLVRNTGVQVDPSGNVRLTNNWELVPLQTNPGGRQLALFGGLATPVRTPLIGLPRPL